MARTYKNAKAILADTMTTIYTCPAGVTAIVFSAQASNVNAAAVAVTAKWTDATDSVATELITNGSVAVGASLGLLTGALVLEAGDSLSALCSTASGAKVSASILERS